MSKLSLREINQSQLDKTPVIDGQFIVCLDTGNAYRDTAMTHVKIGSDLEVVSDLPLAPLAEKLYYLKPDKLYVFLGGNWTLLNDKTIDLDESIAKLPAGSSTSLNDDVEVITQDTDITQPHYYRRKLVVLWEYIKTKAQDFFAAKNHKHGKADITDFPTSMPASDVYPWAKAATKPSYTKAEIGLGKVDNTADANKTVKRATTAGTADSANSVAWENVKDKPTTFPVEAHTHDDRYYTESEMDGKLNSKVNNNEAGANGLFSKLGIWTATPTDDTYFMRQDTGGTNQFGRVKFSTIWNYIKGKADGAYQPKGSYAASEHTHDDRYYTESEVNGKLNEKAVSKTLSKVDLNTVKTPGFYNAGGGNGCTNVPVSSAFGLIVTHNASGEYYTQIFFLVDKNTSYRRYCNGGAWTEWTQDKYTDTNTWRGIQNNLTSDSTSDSLSAAQGKVLKGLVDGKAPNGHTHTKDQVGLGNVDNTADANKSVKYATSAGSASTATKATTADSATTSNGVKDYNDANRTIKIGYAGAGLTAENLSHVAGYTDNGTKIKDVSKDVLKSWIGLGNYLPLGGGTISDALNFANGTWNLVGDDAYMGDHNIAGSFCIMGANDTTRLALVNKDNQGDYALVEYGGGNLNFNKKLGANITGHADGDLPLIGGTMSGQIIKSTGGSWIGDRDRAAIRSGYAGDSSYGAVAAMATKNGYWTMGNLGGNESLIFNYSTDASYNAGKNETSQVYLPAQAGTIITSATIGSQTVNRAEYLANDSAYMRMHWSGQSGQPSWLWGGNDASNMYVWNPSNFSVNYANSAGTVAWGNVSGKPETFTPAEHTHNYAGSGSAGGSANSAVKLDSSAGSANQPVYFSGGKPVAIGYTIAKSVPADAKFTDTNTWRGIQNNLTSDSTDQSLSAAQGKALKTLVDGKAPSVHKHTKSQITDFPTSMPASDVSAWAKAATKPSYTKAEVGLSNVDNTADKDKNVKFATSAGSASQLNGFTIQASTSDLTAGYSRLNNNVIYIVYE